MASGRIAAPAILQIEWARIHVFSSHGPFKLLIPIFGRSVLVPKEVRSHLSLTRIDAVISTISDPMGLLVNHILEILMIVQLRGFLNRHLDRSENFNAQEQRRSLLGLEYLCFIHNDVQDGIVSHRLVYKWDIDLCG